MKVTFTFVIVVVLAALLANRAVVRAQAHEQGSLTCMQASKLAFSSALRHGFDQTAARSQGENFLSACLVAGRAEIGKLVAHD